MTDLLNKKCVPCENQEPLKEGEFNEFMKQLKDGWEVIEGKKIKKRFVFKEFTQAIEFVNKVAELAEKENHHPDFNIRYNKVDIILSTHSIGGLSENDFILAAKIDLL